MEISNNYSYISTLPIISASVISFNFEFGLVIAMSPKVSFLWNFFDPKPDFKARCKLCKQVLAYKSTTNNLKKHMMRRHPTVNLKEERVDTVKSGDSLDQPSTSATTSKEDLLTSTALTSSATTFKEDEITDPTLSPTSSTRAPEKKKTTLRAKQVTMGSFLRKKMGSAACEKIDDALMLLFTKDMQPFSILEDVGFRQYTAALNPSYKLPSRKTVTKSMLPIKFAEAHLGLKEEISKIKACTLTTDTWTSRTTESYIAVTTHFVNDTHSLFF